MDNDVVRRFWAKVAIAGADDCWLWQARLARGYGQFTPKHGTHISAHRLAYMLTYGDIADGLWVLHRCDNPPCVNPAHLWLGTAADNTRDMIAKDRQSPATGDRVSRLGEQNGNAKLSASQVVDIRSLYNEHGCTISGLARRFNVVRGTIRFIVQNKHWVKDVKP